MDFFERVGTVRSMRRLKPEPVPLALLRQVIDAGAHAASSTNLRPWAFVVVREEEGKRFIAEHLDRA